VSLVSEPDSGNDDAVAVGDLRSGGENNVGVVVGAKDHGAQLVPRDVTIGVKTVKDLHHT